MQYLILWKVFIFLFIFLFFYLSFFFSLFFSLSFFFSFLFSLFFFFAYFLLPFFRLYLYFLWGRLYRADQFIYIVYISYQATGNSASHSNPWLANWPQIRGLFVSFTWKTFSNLLFYVRTLECITQYLDLPSSVSVVDWEIFLSVWCLRFFFLFFS